MRRPTPRTICPVALFIGSLGAAGMLLGACLDIDHPVFRFGLVLFLISASLYIGARSATNGAMLEKARQDGYDAGYEDGCSVREQDAAEPLPGGVVAFRRSS